MRGFIDHVLYSDTKLFKDKKATYADVFIFALITIIAAFIRIALFEYVSNDYMCFLENWFNTLKAAGGFKGLGMSLGDYTPPYFYILAALTYLPIDSLYSIKIVSCIFDFALAIIIALWIIKKDKDIKKGIFAYAAMLIAPTIFLNSACWAQCDVIYTLFLVLSVFSLMKEKSLLSGVFLGIAFCFKLQAVFIFPFYVLMVLKEKIKLRYMLAVPIVYIISVIPAFLFGRPLKELLTIYFSQSGQYKQMSLNAPSIYAPIASNTDSYLSSAAILLCASVLILIVYYFASKKIQIDDSLIFSFALLFVLVAPLFLPHMHERYFFVADVFSIIYAFYRPKKFYVPILIIFSSLFVYIPYLFGERPFSLTFLAILLCIAAFIIFKDIINQISIINKTEKAPAI